MGTFSTEYENHPGNRQTVRKLRAVRTRLGTPAFGTRQGSSHTVCDCEGATVTTSRPRALDS